MMLLLSACRDNWQPDALIDTIFVKWNSQGDRSAFTPTLRQCEDKLGYKFTPYGRMEFVPEADQRCMAAADVAGCWYRWYDLGDRASDMAIIQYASLLVLTAMCHEWVHREKGLATGDPDYNHSDIDWQHLYSTEHSLHGLRCEEIDNMSIR
jgi:hypothetical protein